MRGIAEEAEPLPDPDRQRLAIIQRPSERQLNFLQQLPDARIPARKGLPKNIGIAGSRPGFLHLLVGRHESDIVDQLSGAHGEGEEVPPFAEPHLPAVGRPIGNAIMRHKPAVSDRS